METAHYSNLEEVPSSHEKARGDIPLEQTASRPSQDMLSRVGHDRLLLPDQMLMYSYIPPQG